MVTALRGPAGCPVHSAGRQLLHEPQQPPISTGMIEGTWSASDVDLPRSRTVVELYIQDRGLLVDARADTACGIDLVELIERFIVNCSWEFTGLGGPMTRFGCSSRALHEGHRFGGAAPSMSGAFGGGWRRFRERKHSAIERPWDRLGFAHAITDTDSRSPGLPF